MFSLKKAFIIAVIVLISCDGGKHNYTLLDGGDGVFVEHFGLLINDENSYTENNEVYQGGNVYTFDYVHITNTGDSLLFDLEPYSKNWEFSSKFNDCDTTVHIFKLSIEKGMGQMVELVPDYNQTVIQYDYVYDTNSDKLQMELTGCIENEKNIWMHPPRVGYFSILELNPFPYIQAPYEVGNTWEWSLEIGSHYGDERWVTWNGNTENIYTYKITDISNQPTAFGDIECYEITSTGTGKLGETKLVSWFSFDYGFVKLDYTNIDNSKTIIELQEFEKGE